MSGDNIEELSRIILNLRNEIQTPHDSSVEEALLPILEELRGNRIWQAENKKSWSRPYVGQWDNK